MYLLLGKNLAIASCTKALEVRNDKCFRRVTEEGYNPILRKRVIEDLTLGAVFFLYKARLRQFPLINLPPPLVSTTSTSLSTSSLNQLRDRELSVRVASRWRSLS
ncbi:hypothetical protein [Nostoc flagelliforme]|uniref:hypothetical protein n=1 Tax=Nostoc flagelliforme TaxID=1306274 RepID=UPI0012FD08EE|nr:hypothetical protein [Nostoc flagelliforme]